MTHDNSGIDLEAEIARRDAGSDAAPLEHATAPPLDLDSLIARCMGHIELVERVLENFEDRFWPDVHQIESALADGDGQQAARIAHRLKGASASVSAPGLQQLMQLIEQSSREGHLETTAEYLPRLYREWNKVSKHLSALK